MSRNAFGPVKKDRSTLYGVFAILALLPTAFSVSFEYSARGITSGQPWLMAAFPMVLLVAARFIPTVWYRWRAALDRIDANQTRPPDLASAGVVSATQQRSGP